MKAEEETSTLKIDAGDILATRKEEGSVVRLWDKSTGACISSLESPTEVYEIETIHPEKWDELEKDSATLVITCLSVEVWNLKIFDEMYLRLFLRNALRVEKPICNGWLSCAVIFSEATERMYKAFLEDTCHRRYFDNPEYSSEEKPVEFELKCITSKKVRVNEIDAAFKQFSTNNIMNLIHFKKALNHLQLSDHGLERYFVDNFGCKATLLQFKECVSRAYECVE